MAEAAYLELPYPGDRRRRRGLAHRAEPRARCRAPRAAGRPGRLLLHARRRGRGAGDALRPPRRRLVRRARRPEHAGELAEREPLGHAVPDAARLRHRAPADAVLVGARNLDPPEVEFIAASGLRTGVDEVVDGARRRRRRLRRLRRRRARPGGRGRLLHARAERLHGRRGARPAPADRRRAAGRRHRRHRARAPPRRTRARSPGSRARSGSRAPKP